MFLVFAAEFPKFKLCTSNISLTTNHHSRPPPATSHRRKLLHSLNHHNTFSLFPYFPPLHYPQPSHSQPFINFLTLCFWQLQSTCTDYSCPLLLGFLSFEGGWKIFGVDLHHLVSELHTICLTKILTNTTWGTIVSGYTVWLKT